jgi:CRP-like cAMP-binding protein
MPDHQLNESRVGRPTKYSEETVARLCKALAQGLPIRGACVVAGIGVTTLAEWREQHPGLEEQMNQAREAARQKALQSIQAAGEKDWRANAEWLKLAFPADYRGNANRIEVTANACVSSGMVLTEEDRMRLLERREKALLASAGKDKGA